MDKSERGVVKNVLGNLYFDHADKAMAFVWKAAASLQPGAVGEYSTIATSRQPFGGKVAGGVDRKTRFPDSSAGAVYGIRILPRGHSRAGLRHLESSEGRATDDRASPSRTRYRRVRGQGDSGCGGAPGDRQSDGDGRWEVFQTEDWQPTPGSWLPRSQRSVAVIARLRAAGLPRVKDLFYIRLGIRTGLKRAFVVPRKQALSLPREEVILFRPVAGNDTILNGRIRLGEYIFYPYRGGESAFKSEEELREQLKDFFRTHLSNYREELLKRASRRGRQWWEPSEPRLTWQG